MISIFDKIREFFSTRTDIKTYRFPANPTATDHLMYKLAELAFDMEDYKLVFTMHDGPEHIVFIYLRKVPWYRK